MTDSHAPVTRVHQAVAQMNRVTLEAGRIQMAHRDRFLKAAATVGTEHDRRMRELADRLTGRD